ncbi:hypothetical protein NC651_029404 [Populus alba x Populus x berolinensis]|nr:hypothetical protein NC651_029404 [Populus alba x Populus x berolinensis]
MNSRGFSWENQRRRRRRRGAANLAV